MGSFDEVRGVLYLGCTGKTALKAHMKSLDADDSQGGLPSFTVLGDIFIKNAYVVLSYDGSKLDKPSVGIGHRTDLPVVM